MDEKILEITTQIQDKQERKNKRLTNVKKEKAQFIIHIITNEPAPASLTFYSMREFEVIS